MASYKYEITYGNGDYSNAVSVDEYTVEPIINGINVLVLKCTINSKPYIIPFSNVISIGEY